MILFQLFKYFLWITIAHAQLVQVCYLKLQHTQKKKLDFKYAMANVSVIVRSSDKACWLVIKLKQYLEQLEIKTRFAYLS